MQEVTAEFAVDELVAPVELKVKPHFEIACKTDIGRVREINEDKFEYFLVEDHETLATRGSVFVVCDGMGGHAAGQIASELASKTFIESYYQHVGTDPMEAARSAIHLAHRFVMNVQAAIPSRRGMGTTMDAVAFCQDHAILAHIGDSRVYRLRDGSLEQITKDHSWVQDMVDGGVMTEAEAEQHPNRNALTRCIGYDNDFRPDVFRVPLEPGDLWILVSDGVTKCTTMAEMHQCLVGPGSLSKAAWDLVTAAMNGGGTDNATVILVRVTELESVATAVTEMPAPRD